MKVGIVGSRDFDGYYTFRDYMDSFRKHIQIDMIISGGAKGVDSMAYRYAVEKGITFMCFPPIPEERYPAKFFNRNARIVEMSEVVIAFPKGKSSGTRHSISLAKKLGKELYVIEVPECNHLRAEFDFICANCKKLVKGYKNE